MRPNFASIPAFDHSDPNDSAPALARAIAVVKSGEPAVLDVVTDPRVEEFCDESV